MARVEHRSALPIDPRFLARLVAVHRDQGRRRFRVVKWAVVATAVVAGLWGLSRSPLLRLRHIAVGGATHTRRDAILSATGLDRHHQMVDLSPAQLRERLRALPWVGDVSIRRRWPTSLKLEITERLPVAQIFAATGQTAIVDIGGRVLAVGQEASSVVARQRPALPRLTGTAPAPAAGQVLGQRANAALALVSAVARAVSESLPALASGERGTLTVTAVGAEPDGTLTVSLSPGVVVIFGAADQRSAQLLALRTVLTQLGPDPQVTIDLRVPDSPVLTEGNSRSIVSTIQRG